MGQRRDVIAIVVGMLFVVAVAAWVIFQAAYHPIRGGSRVLAPEGERLAAGLLRLTRIAAAGEPRADPAAEPQPEPRAGGQCEPESEPESELGSEPQSEAQAEPRADLPPRQQGSPLATPASGVSETIAR
jgi:hypothetical protein